MKKVNLKNLVNFFYEIGTLRRVQRSYHINVLEDTESVAEHTHRAMIVAYTLAKLVGCDAQKALMMSAFHDMPETRTSDSNWIQKQYMNQDEEKALHAQLSLMGGLGDDIDDLLAEYQKRETLEAKVAKDADNIEYYLSLREIELRGNREAARRLSGKNVLDTLYTDEAKELTRLLLEVGPTEWTLQDLRETFKKYKVEGDKKI
jgi:putative hydrolases of HD superfamily